jgi:hypothetical protein
MESSSIAEANVVETDRIGYDLLNDPLLNKGTGFTDEERELFELHGLLPPSIATLDEQVSRRLQAFRQLPDDFQRYLFLRGLQNVSGDRAAAIYVDYGAGGKSVTHEGNDLPGNIFRDSNSADGQSVGGLLQHGGARIG